MAFLTVGKKVEAKRRLYLFNIEMPSGMKCVKIGVASHESSLDRMMTVNRSIFQKYRCTAKIGIARDREVPADKCFKYETILHHFFKDYQYTPPVKFDGSTELFAIPIEDAKQALEAVIEGEEPDFTYVLPNKEESVDLPF